MKWFRLQRSFFAYLITSPKEYANPPLSTPSLAVVRKAICALLLAVGVIAGWIDYRADAQERPKDLTELPIEELAKLDVISINVLGTHTHLAGQWMLAYKYMFVSMDGNRKGTKRISNTEVLRNFDAAPTDMTMQMHMPMVMYAPSDDLSLMAMIPYIRQSMNHVTREGVRFKEKTEGIGDLHLNALYTFYRYREWEHRLALNAGLSFPTGSIHQKDFGHHGGHHGLGRARLGYPMQLGSGTFDLLPGVTYFGQSENWAWGAEVIPTIRVGKNRNGYRLGNRYELAGWGARKLTDWLSLSARLDGQIWQNIHGSDPALDPADDPTKDAKIQGGKRVDFLLGINLYAPRGILQGHRLAIEGGVPIYQWLDGPQLQTKWKLAVGWQWVF
jgi:hypothetical protein